MKTVRIYELAVKFERVSTDVDTWEVFSYDPIANIDERDSSKGKLQVEGGVLEKRIYAIQRFRVNAVKDQVKLPDELFDFDDLYEVDDEYIVLDPHVEHLLAAKYRDQIADLTMKKHNAEMMLMRQSEDFKNWWSMPWYKRVWSALRG